MSKIEIRTDKSHRFGKEILLNGNVYNISLNGTLEVAEEDIKSAILAGYMVVNEEDLENLDQDTNEGASLIQKAQEEAARIIKEAQEEAARITQKAQEEAADEYNSSTQKEIDDLRETMSKLTLTEIKAYLEANSENFPKDDYKSFTKKNDFIDYIVETTYGE